MNEMEALLSAIGAEAKRAPFPIDEEVYRNHGLDPFEPILFAGRLETPLCFFGRDLGREEVHARQPLCGSAGRLVRGGIHRALFGSAPPDDQALQAAAQRVLLTNTVPYKPPGNKPYSEAVKARFRPFVERLLVFHWTGSQIITLGAEAFQWFTPYAPAGAVKSFWQRQDRFTAELPVMLQATEVDGQRRERSVILAPLPHPSPLNQQYYALFPEMILQRLRQYLVPTNPT